MRHKLKSTKLNRTSSHRAAMFSNMIVALVMHEQIKTTLPKAKALRPIIEKIVTKARKNTLAARREIIAQVILMIVNLILMIQMTLKEKESLRKVRENTKSSRKC